MKLFLFCSALICISCSYDKKDFNFSKDELSIISSYKAGDTIYFKSNKGDLDTILILRIDTIQKRKSGFFLAQPASNRINVVITHLPIDRWVGHSHDMTTDIRKIVHQNIISLSKYPQRKERHFGFQFKDFYSFNKMSFGEFRSDTLRLGERKIANYYLINHQEFGNRAAGFEDIDCIYWTNEFGLTAYKNMMGEVWVRNN